MNGSWLPKVIGIGIGVAGLAAPFFPQYTAIFAAANTLLVSVLALIVRQDNKSSEQVGAGNTGAEGK